MLSPAALATRLRPSRKLLNWFAVCMAAYALFGFVVVPHLVRTHGERLLGEITGRAVTMDAVRFNPFTLALTVEGLRVMEADGGTPAFTLARTHANLELESVLRRGLVLHELRLDDPRLEVVRFDDGRYNWSDVIDRLAAGKVDEGGEPARFSLGNIQLAGGQAVFDDRHAGVRHELRDLVVQLPFVSNLPVKVDVFVEPAVTAMLNGHPLNLSGKSLPFAEGRETALELKLDKLEIAPYLAYLPFEPAFALPSGHLSTELRLAFRQDVAGDPYIALNGEVRLGDLQVDDADGRRVLGADEIAVELVEMQPLAGKWHFTRLRVQSPVVELVRERDGSLNLVRLLPSGADGPADREPAADVASAPIDFLLATARVRDGVVSIEDRVPATPFATRLEAINIDLRDLATIGDMPAVIRADFHTPAGERFDFQEQLRLAPFEIEGTASVYDLLPAGFAPYYESALAKGEIRGGKLDAVVRHRVRAGDKAPEIELTVESLALREAVLGLKDRKQTLLELPMLSAAEIVVQPAAHRVQVREATVQGLAVALLRDRNGHLDAADFLAPARDDGPAGPAWDYAIARLAVEAASLHVEDRSAGTPVMLDAERITFSAEDLSNTRDGSARIMLDAQINKRGHIAMSGMLGLAPVKAELELDLVDVDLLPLQPYVLEETKIAISRGSLTTKGNVVLAQTAAGDLKVRFRGDLGVANFASVDRLNATDFVRWRTLRLAGVDVALVPFALAIREIALIDFHTRLILDSQGQLNLREIRPQAEADEAGPAVAEMTPPGPPPPLSIGRVVIRQGNIAFSDRFIRPNYDANLSALSGELRGLSSDPETLARLELAGKADKTAPVTIRGEFNPFRDDRRLDIAAEVKDFELTGVSAYSGKYVGYGIEKGKLSAELSYKIEDRKLTATNRVFLDQLTFGPPTDSPDAIKAPVQLAVSLLKNRRGEIDLHLPVSGTLDDPQFSIGGLVFRAIMNLLAKAITSPFALLGSMFGDGEALSQLEFDSGSAVLGPAVLPKVQSLADALLDRPALALEITGLADPGIDADGLRQEVLKRQLRAAKVKAMLKRGEEPPSLDEVPIADEEYAALLREVYRSGDFKKERNFLGLVKDVPVAQMEEVILANTAVSADDLNALAQQRALAARNWLVEQGGVPAERVFVLASKVEVPGEDGCGTCVRFSLR